MDALIASEVVTLIAVHFLCYCTKLTEAIFTFGLRRNGKLPAKNLLHYIGRTDSQLQSLGLVLKGLICAVD